MTTKLSWSYDQTLNCEVAYLRGYRIRAEHDDDASNPFEDMDGHWPIAVYFGRSLTIYDKAPGPAIRDPLLQYPDALLVHDQKALEKLLGAERGDLHMYGVEWGDDESPPKWVTDADALRSWFSDALESEYNSKKLEVWEQLYTLLGVPCYRTTVTGYCQGDWADVLVVATPEAQKEFAPGWQRTGDVEAIKKDLESTAELYGAWAFGDVYGYIVEKPVYDDDGEVEWVDACDHNSCWGYYGADHAESGLEEAALECVPEEPVVSDDKIEEDV